MESEQKRQRNRCPDIGREFVPLLRCQYREPSLALLALSDGDTSRPNYVDERSALAGACSLTSVWR